MNLLSSVQGQPVVRELLQRSLARGRVHHAYCFEGPAGVGKFLTALGLAQALVCTERAPDGDAACGACSACERAVLRDGEKRPLHPDISIVARGLYDPHTIGRRTPESQEISVDQIRSVVLAHASYGAHEGKARVFVLRSAEQLGVSAANALLKMLEEPLPQTHFVLVTDHLEQLLPTLRSRTLTVRFGPLGDGPLAAVLQAQGVPDDEIAALVEAADGSVARALQLRDAPAQSAAQAFVREALAALESREAAPILALSDAAKGERGELNQHLHALSRHFVLAARSAVDGGQLDEAERDAERYALVRQAIAQLKRNAAPPLVLESLLLTLRRS